MAAGSVGWQIDVAAVAVARVARCYADVVAAQEDEEKDAVALAAVVVTLAAVDVAYSPVVVVEGPAAEQNWVAQMLAVPLPSWPAASADEDVARSQVADMLPDAEEDAAVVEGAAYVPLPPPVR